MNLRRLLLPALLLAACGSKHEQAVTEYLEVLEDINDILDGIKDKKSAQAARPKLERLATRMRTLQAKMEKLPEPTEADLKRAEKRSGELDKQMQRLMANSMRIGMNPELSDALEPLGDIDRGR
jgi:polyhydroxyalkanoate synthesis regulator phasin